MITSLILLLLLVAQLLSLTLIYQQISKTKLSNKELITLFLLTLLVVSFMSYFFYIVIILYFYFLGRYHGLKQKKNLAAFYSIYSVTILTVIGNLTQLFIDRFFSTNLIMTLFLQFMPYFINTLMLRVFEPNFDFLAENYEWVNKKFLFNMNGLLFLLCTVQFSGYFLELRQHEIVLLNILKTIVFLIIIIVLLFYLNMKTQLLQKEQLEELKEKQFSDLIQYTTQIEELYGEIRNIRHDYVNIIASIKIGIEENDIGQIKEIYTEVLSEVNQSLQNNKYDLMQLSKIKIPAVKGVISAKLLMAFQQGLSVNVEIFNEFNEIYINTLDFIRIISIFLDNAIEASCETEMKQLTIGLIQEQTRQIIIINNSVKELAIDKRKIFTKGYSTKGSKRGLGLSIAKDILANYPNALLETEIQDYLFTQTLSIQKKGISE